MWDEKTVLKTHSPYQRVSFPQEVTKKCLCETGRLWGMKMESYFLGVTEITSLITRCSIIIEVNLYTNGCIRNIILVN